MRSTLTTLSALLVLLLVLTGCEPGPRDLRYGEEECAYCMMRVTDRPFGSQLVTEQGRTYAFDSIECLASYVEEGRVATEDIHSIWVPNFANPEGDWLAAEDALYLHSENLQSPMGLALTAYDDQVGADEHQAEYGGTLYDWGEMRELVSTTRIGNATQHGH